MAGTVKTVWTVKSEQNNQKSHRIEWVKFKTENRSVQNWTANSDTSLGIRFAFRYNVHNVQGK